MGCSQMLDAQTGELTDSWNCLGDGGAAIQQLQWCQQNLGPNYTIQGDGSANNPYVVYEPQRPTM